MKEHEIAFRRIQREMGWITPLREEIVAVAIKYGPLVITLPQPARHHNIIHNVHDYFGFRTKGDDEQGFITSLGNFVDRKEALEIAQRMGQIVKKHGNPNELYSEDLW